MTDLPTTEFVRAGADGEPVLVGRNCTACGHIAFPAHQFGCEACGADPEQTREISLSGGGRLINFVGVAQSDRKDADQPVWVGLIRLADGVDVRVLLDPELTPAPEIGMPVKAVIGGDRLRFRAVG